MKIKQPLQLATLIVLLSACSTPLSKKSEDDTKSTRGRLAAIIHEQKASKTPSFTEQTEPTLAITPLGKAQQKAFEKEWLTNIRITLDPARKSAIPAHAIIRMLRDKGINIVTSLPLDLYTYNGFGVTDVNAETALTVFMGAMGLDFDIDNTTRLITIEPMKPKTWTFNIGNRRTNFSAGASATDSGSGSSMTGTAPLSDAQSAAPTTTGGISSTSTGSVTSSAGGTNTSGITSSDDVWSKLSTELTARLTILVPKTNAHDIQPIVPAIGQIPGIQIQGMQMQGMQMPGQGQMPNGSSNFYNAQTVGRFSINAETGAITVQAPKYILKSLDEYLTKVQEMYNTTITFEGELVTVTTNDNKSEGIDWTALDTFHGGGFGTVMQNNILGGAIISPADGTNALVSTVTTGNNGLPGAGTLLGIASATKKFAMFNAFLSSVGQLKIKDTPLVTTTSGTPVKFQNQVTRHYQQYQQTAASGGVGSAAVATNTVDVPYKIGMTLRINPRYDVHTGLVRAQYSLERSMINGWEQKINPISTGNTVQIINTQLPIIADTSNDGELLLKNGDLVVVGGLTEDSEDNNDSGITGTLDTPFKALTGKGSRNKSTTTYYFALRVTVTKKD